MARAFAFVAGEASGDLIAAPVLPALAARAGPVRCGGIGGDRMIAAGFDAWHHVRELSVRGYVEVLRHLPRLLQLRRALTRRLLAAPPAAFIGVDAPDFNLALEARLRAAGIPTVHFVGPSIWAWRPERIDTIRRAVDHMLLVFPFERALYDRAGIAATYVGHPLASVIPLAPDAAAARARLGLAVDRPLLALLPGSRQAEVDFLAPVFLDALTLLRADLPDLQAVLPVADPALRPALAAALAARPQLAGAVLLTAGRSYDALEAADAVLLASGTATLEAALFKRPMVIAYRMPRVSAWIMRRKGIIEWVGLPNILCQEALVPELLQEHCTAPALARATLPALTDPAVRARLADRFLALHHTLRRDTAALAADAILRVAR